MSIKTDLQGLLIYLTMAGYLLTLLTAIQFRRSIVPKILFFGAFLLSLASLVYRWVHVQHVPMQNMFEVFLVLGFCIWPIHVLSNKMLGRFHSSLVAMDAVIGLIVLFPAGFVFDHSPQYLPPALQFWLFGPHVAAYMLSYIFMAKAAVFAFASLVSTEQAVDTRKFFSDYSYRLVAAGFPLLTLGLFLGSIWGKYAWGDWWGWDPKELWSLVCWLVYALYLHYRYAWPKSLRMQNVLVILGLIAIIITLLWVNLSKIFGGLHNYAS